MEEVKDVKIRELTKRLFESPLIVCAVDATDENQMKNYLLHNDKRLKKYKKQYVLLEDGLKSLYLFLKEHHFIVVHLKYDQSTLLQTLPKDCSEEAMADFIKTSDVQMGILFKKADTSMATFLKCYDLKD